MTSKLTRLTDDELTETLRQATSGYPLPASVEGNLRHAFAELQERRKAEKDSEPVAWTDEEELRDVNVAGIGYLFGIDREANKFADPRRQIMLYRHAQPAPETEREPIAWLNDAYLARGVVDGEAGSEDAGPGYIPVYRQAGPQPAPVVPDEIKRNPDTGWYVGPDGKNWSALQANSCNACRAAILAAARQSPGSEPATVPGKWIPVSERMPEDRTQVILWDAEIGEVTSGHYSHKTHTFYHCGDAIQNEITHWMPLPAAPQEVKGE